MGFKIGDDVNSSDIPDMNFIQIMITDPDRTFILVRDGDYSGQIAQIIVDVLNRLQMAVAS